ncbi:MAG: cytochrome c oxidase accessory protein CcoG [Ignavibacteria bacterium RIFOXYB2_FULL_35_12]|nr:MAG: cytochrome c oxidase accessory protein CcoG [Ignavibacteria bacterium GWA2_36_19]OGU50409.1 MAG: cytochrome c oxidase accessory protein CcoG [Ignavibacteria bacterium GWC2_35_8]OGU59648.1 MAG: cytochrome c oxidase accessory protein CcoG [Ignavibacteria bacterium GWF2_35_20]OGU82846.1 MAG: cytochrome c oxidase accessory protein CcoG [Ignavibacteria bacterium RIFOXYA2_FULL_35_9]OGU84698.1 MAG: cytochrome c oxidase accessory protein CcoG [Ignavibacteria bacterium RIFOXYA12_FULL_35_25]OGU8
MSEIKTEESFRDYIATVTKEGKRKWIYPKKPSGRFYNARTVVSLFLILFLVSTPFIKVNGHPFLLFDFLNRNFILFTIPFGPHDFHLFALAIIALAVFVILFTVIFGRVFCGWACPQTIFMEMVFRKIEYWIEGDFKDQTKLNQAPWTSNKIFKKTIKHAIYFPIAFFISNIFLSYVIGMDELIKIITAPPSKHLAGFISMLAFSGIFYWIFSYFREQVCTLVCPYGRLQGVLLDQDSIVIAYDNFRGEPRGKLKKNEAKSKLGDCIDCNLCVDVCPTGIDIRNGIQLECVNCTACIDACDTVMDKIDRPRGLIRYDSLRGIEKKEKFHFTPRMAGYSSVLILILSVLSYLLVTRSDLSINILRTPGLLFQEQPDNKCSNIYDLNITNKSFNYTPIELKLKNVEGELKLLGDELNLKPQEKHDSKFLLILPKTSIAKMNTPITILVYSNDKLLKEVKTSFLGPVAEKGKS